MLQRLILVVDDSEDDQEMTRVTLRKELCWQLVFVDSGFDALEWLDSNKKPDLVLTDFMMPGMDGIQLIRRIRKNDATKDLPIILTTGGYLSKIDRQTLETLGASFLSKNDFEGGNLKEVIEKQLNKGA